jgi:hypothetical protein
MEERAGVRIPRKIRASIPWTVAADVRRLYLRFVNFRRSLLTSAATEFMGGCPLDPHQIHGREVL